MVIVAQLVRAPDCGSGGRRFETGLSPNKVQGIFYTLGLFFSCTFFFSNKYAKSSFFSFKKYFIYNN